MNHRVLLAVLSAITVFALVSPALAQVTDTLRKVDLTVGRQR